MRKAVRFIFHITLIPLFKILLKRKEIWFFEGIRRSGNHACIYWIANARLKRKAPPQELSHYCFYSFSKEVFFINSYAQESALTMLKHVWKNRRLVIRCKILFLSIEDESSSLLHFLNLSQFAHRHIGITRSLPNVLASRLQKIERESLKLKEGIAQNFVITPKILRLFFKAREAKYVWIYDDWLSDLEWRAEFLASVGLSMDIMPEVTPQGGGSSFETRAVQLEQNRRFERVECPSDLHEMILGSCARLPKDECDLLRNWINRTGMSVPSQK